MNESTEVKNCSICGKQLPPSSVRAKAKKCSTCYARRRGTPSQKSGQRRTKGLVTTKASGLTQTITGGGIDDVKRAVMMMLVLYITPEEVLKKPLGEILEYVLTESGINDLDGVNKFKWENDEFEVIIF